MSLAALHEQFWWFTARSTGLMAWALALGSILVGLALATRALGNKPRAPWLLDLHRYIGGATVIMVGLHMAALVADSYVRFTLADLLVPFASDWKRLPVAAGVTAFWLLGLIEITSLMMRRLPKKRWRQIHMLSYAVAVLSTVHTFTAGTDASNPALIWIFGGVLGATLFFALYRVLLPKRKPIIPPRNKPAGATRRTAEVETR